jgi:hypothetical protein
MKVQWRFSTLVLGVAMIAALSGCGTTSAPKAAQATPAPVTTTLGEWWTSVDACLATAQLLVANGDGDTRGAMQFTDDFGTPVNGSTYQDANGNWHQSRVVQGAPGPDPSSILGPMPVWPYSQHDNAMVYARQLIMGAAAQIRNQLDSSQVNAECQRVVDAAAGTPAADKGGWTGPSASEPPTPEPTTPAPAPSNSPLVNVDWSSLTHKLDCSAIGQGIEIRDKDYFDLTGDGKKEAFVRVACNVLTGGSSDQVEVYDGGSSLSAPRLLGVLHPYKPSAPEEEQVKIVTVSGSVVTVSGIRYLHSAEPNPNWTQTYTWSGGAFHVKGS